MMKKIIDGLRSFPPYQWGVSIGNALGVHYGDSKTAKVFKRTIFNAVAPVATVYSAYMLVVSAAALVMAPFVAAPAMAFGSAAYGVLMGVIFTPWVAGVSENGMKENITLLKSPFVKKRPNVGSDPYSTRRIPAQAPASNGFGSKLKSVFARKKTISAPVIIIDNRPTPPKK